MTRSSSGPIIGRCDKYTGAGAGRKAAPRAAVVGPPTSHSQYCKCTVHTEHGESRDLLETVKVLLAGWRRVADDGEMLMVSFFEFWSCFSGPAQACSGSGLLCGDKNRLGRPWVLCILYYHSYHVAANNYR